MKVVNFMGLRKIATVLSLLLVIASLTSIATQGIKFGLDFTGGTQIEVGYSDVEPLENIRATIANAGYRNAVVVQFGSETDILVRLPDGYSDTLGAELIAVLQNDFAGEIDLRRVEFVGPQVGDELKEQGGLAVLMALIVVMIYIAFRFQFKFSVAAVVGLVHDVIITLGVFSLLQLDFDLTVMAALLAVIGYSLNDTIVVADRIRENFRKLRKSDPEQVINISLTETLDRTLVTSLTTILVLVALFVFGGEMIHGFATALIVGIVVGTYSSVYVASSLLMLMDITKADLIAPVKEGSEVNDLP
ncbi:MAG: protein translocase subunit SecF [Spongiibacteraceae bacterium]